METKQFKICEEPECKAVAVDDEVLSRINHFTLTPLTPDEISVRRMVLAHDQVDRTHERFSPGVLKRFAETIPGKSFLVGHGHDTAPVGRFFDAEVVGTGTTGGHKLLAHFYTLKDTEGNSLAKRIDAGIYRHVSIGFRCEKLVCDICSQDMKKGSCPHYPGKEYDGTVATGTWEGRAEALEGSLVFLGAQPGAVFVKAENLDGIKDVDGEKVWEDPPGGEWIHHKLRSSDDFVRIRAMWLSEKEQIQARLGPLKSDPQGGTKVQSLLFKKPKWTMEKAKAWMAEHPDVGKTLRQSVQIGMAVVLGSRSGVRGSKSAYDELAAQYRELGEDPPEWKAYTQNALRKCFADVWATVKANYGKDGEDVEKIEELESKNAELEASVKSLTEAVKGLKVAAAEAEELRADLIGEIVKMATATGHEALYTCELLGPMPAKRLKEVAEGLKREWDKKYPPVPATAHLESPKSDIPVDISAYKLS
jgi:hypothetical protein